MDDLINNGQPEQQPEQIQLVINFNPQTGQVQINGPINNRMLSYALLKMGEKAIDENHERMQKQQAKIVNPNQAAGFFAQFRGRG